MPDHDPGDIEDIVQDVFLAALRSIDTFKGNSSLRTWMLSITGYKCRDVQRQMIRHQAKAYQMFRSQLELLEDFSGLGSSPEIDIIGQENIQLLRKALDKLDPVEQHILILRYMENRSLTDMAIILKMSPSTVRRRVERARSKLRSLLEDEQ